MIEKIITTHCETCSCQTAHESIDEGYMEVCTELGVEKIARNHCLICGDGHLHNEDTVTALLKTILLPLKPRF